MSDSPVIKEQIEIYRRSFLEHGDAPMATFNTGRTVQNLRFERLIRPLIAVKPLFSIHDVGAGLCDLHRYLLDEKIEHDYSATEIVREMADLAAGKYPEVKVYVRDINCEPCDDRHDFVVQSGVFNIPGNVARDDWREYILRMLRKMYDICDVAMAFNFLTSYRTFTDPDLFYLDPKEMLDFCMTNLSRFVMLDHGYPLYECTMAVFKPGFVQSRHDLEAFAKYFKTK